MECKRQLFDAVTYLKLSKEEVEIFLKGSENKHFKHLIEIVQIEQSVKLGVEN